MSNFLQLGLRFCTRRFSNPMKLIAGSSLNQLNRTPAYSRALWHMCSTSRTNSDFLKPVVGGECCRCGCAGALHTGGEQDLVQFLGQEISEEKKSQRMKTLPADLHGFAISSDHATLTFTKKNQLETVIVNLNVNHSVDAEVGEDGNYSEEMRSKPNFEVDIVRDNKTLSFSCSFIEFDESSDRDAGDVYEITDVTYFEGEWSDKHYSVAADLLDENLYDLFMLLLEGKGIKKQFVLELSEIATSYEHSQYIGLLENVRKFVSN